MGKGGVDFVEGIEELAASFVVGSLGLGKAAAVDAIVYGGIDFLIPGIDAGAQLGGIKVAIALLGNVIKGRVQDDDNLGAFIVDDGLAFLIPKYGYRAASAVARFPQLIQLAQGSTAFVGFGEYPDAFIARRHHLCHCDRILQSFQCAGHQGAVGPGTTETDVEAIAPCC